MKKLLFYFFFTVAPLGAILVAYNIRARSNVPDIKSSKVEAKISLINLGAIKLNRPAVGRFVIYNKGTAIAKIFDVKADCHCTIPAITKNFIKIGDSAEVFLKYDASVPGSFQKNATIIVNDSPAPVLLTIRGLVQDSL